MKKAEILKSQIVFSNHRDATVIRNDSLVIRSQGIKSNDKNEMDGLKLLDGLHDSVISACFFDPQYRGFMDKMNYGNEGTGRQIKRTVLSQMTEETITDFIFEINRVLVSSGHLFLWIDKFHLCEGTGHWFKNTSLSVVDLITWDKGRMGMGYRTRRKSEYLLILQKEPKRAKGVWTNHSIPDNWLEKIEDKKHTHQKPLQLQTALIQAVSAKGDYILDPCAGSYKILDACVTIERNFIGCDIESSVADTSNTKRKKKNIKHYEQATINYGACNA